MPGGLLDRTVDFVQALRRAGLPVSLAESLDTARAFGAVDVVRRERLRAGLAATTVKQLAHRPAFDALFDLHFPVVRGEPSYAGRLSDDGDGRTGAESPLPRDELAQQMRERLRGLLLDGRDDELRRFAREAVRVLGRAEAQAGRQSFFSYRAMRALSPETLVAGLVAAILQGRDAGPGGARLAEAVARSTVTRRIRALEQHVEAEVRRRLAEEKGRERVERIAVKPLVDQVDFLRASTADMEQLRRTVQPLSRHLATRLAARRRLGRRGRLDFRRTVRSSLASGGVPLDTRHRPRRPHKPELVVLCDVSGSVASFAHFTLLLTYALHEQFTKVRAFAFVDTCDEVTGYFERGTDLADALERMRREARLVWFDGHSDYGHSLEVFAERYADALTPRTSLLVLGDARTNYRPPSLPVLHRIVGAVRHAYWLNPEPRNQWGTGDSAALHYSEVVEMVECRNAAQLEGFVRRVLPTRPG